MEKQNKKVLLLKDFQIKLVKHAILYNNNATYTYMRKSVQCILYCFHCWHLSLTVRHNSYAIYCTKYGEKKQIFEVQKYTEYPSALFTVFFFFHCNCWGIIQPPEQTLILHIKNKLKMVYQHQTAKVLLCTSTFTSFCIVIPVWQIFNKKQIHILNQNKKLTFITPTLVK
jgi:hypothetical protein